MFQRKFQKNPLALTWSIAFFCLCVICFSASVIAQSWVDQRGAEGYIARLHPLDGLLQLS